MREMKDRRLWTQEEDQAIIQLVQLYGNKKWTVISQKMQFEYAMQARTGKQCRERWYNHLDPQINKTEWTDQEETVIFEAHRKYGNKWKEIARSLQGRTDNSVKNHFYSTLRRSLRRINKFLGSKNSTSQMRDIKPSVLSRILEFSMEADSRDADLATLSESYRDLPSLLFEFSNFKPVKDNILVRSDMMSVEERQRFELIIQKILEFNNLYDRQKKAKSRNRKRSPQKPPRKRARTQSLHNPEIPDTLPSDLLTLQPTAQSLLKLQHPHHLPQSSPTQSPHEYLTADDLHYQSDGELSDKDFVHELREPSMKSECLQEQLMVVGTPVKLNVAGSAEAERIHYEEEQQQGSDEILEINYID